MSDYVIQNVRAIGTLPKIDTVISSIKAFGFDNDNTLSKTFDELKTIWNKISNKNKAKLLKS